MQLTQVPLQTPHVAYPADGYAAHLFAGKCIVDCSIWQDSRNRTTGNLISKLSQWLIGCLGLCCLLTLGRPNSSWHFETAAQPRDEISGPVNAASRPGSGEPGNPRPL